MSIDLLKRILFFLCVAMINLGHWRDDIHLQISAIFWAIMLGKWEELR